MTDSNVPSACLVCGAPIDERDFDRNTCHDCRSPAGKIIELDVAIRNSEDNPERIQEWPVIRHFLRKRFGEDLVEIQLWDRCTDWLQAEGRMTAYAYMSLPLSYLAWLLEHGFPDPGQAEIRKFEALMALHFELESRMLPQASREQGLIAELGGISPSLTSAIVALQPFYGGVLPKPALYRWRYLESLAGSDPATAKSAAEPLLEWVAEEINSSRANLPPTVEVPNGPSGESSRGTAIDTLGLDPSDVQWANDIIEFEDLLNKHPRGSKQPDEVRKYLNKIRTRRYDNPEKFARAMAIRDRKRTEKP